MLSLLLGATLLGEFRLPVYLENTLGVPAYPNALPVVRSRERDFGMKIVGSQNPKVVFYAKTNDRTVLVKKFYQNHLTAVKVSYDGSRIFFPDSPNTGGLRLIGRSKDGRTVRINCFPEGNGKVILIEVTTEGLRTRQTS